MNIPIVIVSYNKKDLLKQCIENIRINTKETYELVLVDNGSDSETSDFINSQRNRCDVSSVIRLFENGGFARGYNVGLKEVCDRPYSIILNNDTIPSKDWLSGIMSLLDSVSNSNVGLVLPYTNFCCNAGIVVENEKIETSSIEINGNVPAVCWLITRKCYTNTCRIIEKLEGGNNFFHNDFKYGWAEDILTSEIITRLGFKKYAAGGSFIYHYGSATQNILKTTENYREDNMKKLGKYLKELDEIDKKEFDII